MDFIHLSAALTRLAKLSPVPHVVQDISTRSDGLVAGQPSPKVSGWRPAAKPSGRTSARPVDHATLVYFLVRDLVPERSNLRGRELCNVLWALAKLGGARAWDPMSVLPLDSSPDLLPGLGSEPLHPSNALEALLAEVPRCLLSCNGQELSTLLYAVALMGRPLCGRQCSAVGRRRWATGSSIATVGEAGLGAGAGSAASQAQQGPLSGAANVATQVHTAAHSSQTTALAHTSQTAAAGPAGQAAVRASRLSQHAASQGLVAVEQPAPTATAQPSGQATCQVPEPTPEASGPGRPLDLQRPVLGALAQALTRGDLGPQALANTTWALGRLARLGDSRAPLLAAPLLGPGGLGGPALYSLPPEGLSAVAVGLAWLGARPSVVWCARFGVASGQVLHVASTQALCNMLWGLLSVGRRPPRRWLARLLAEVQRRLDAQPTQAVQPQDAAALVYCLARLGVRPPLSLLAPLMSLLYEGLVASGGASASGSSQQAGRGERVSTAQPLSSQGMANASLALWRLGARPSTAWVEALLRAAYVTAPYFSQLGAHMLLSSLEGLGYNPSRRFVARLGAHLSEGWREAAQQTYLQSQTLRKAGLQAMQARSEQLAIRLQQQQQRRRQQRRRQQPQHGWRQQQRWGAEADKIRAATREQESMVFTEVVPFRRDAQSECEPGHIQAYGQARQQQQRAQPSGPRQRLFPKP